MSNRLRFYAVTHDLLGDPFWEVFRQGLFDAAERFGCEVHHLRPERYSPAQMEKLIEYAIEARPDGLLSTIPEVSAVDAPLRRALKRGIPLIAVNTSDPRPKSQPIPYLFFIGSDDQLGGRVAAERTLAEGGCEEVFCVDHYEFDQVCHRARYNGYAEVMRKAGAACQRLHVPGSDEARSVQLIRQYLRAHPKVDAILTLGPPGSAAVVAALDAEKAHGRIRHVTFDLSPLQLKAIKEGKILATIDSQQYLQGYLGIEHLWLHVRYGFTLAADIFTGPSVVTRANLAAVEKSVVDRVR